MTQWQFSIRQLLVLTAISAVVLTLVVRFPLFRVVVLCVLPLPLSVVLLRLFQSLSATTRRRLGIAVLLTYGSLALFAAAASAWQLTRDHDESTAFIWFLVATYGLMAVACYWFAVRTRRRGRAILSDGTEVEPLTIDFSKGK